MFKTLRTPTVFFLLTLVIFGWLLSWQTPNPYSLYIMAPSRPTTTDFRPAHWLSTLIIGRRPRITAGHHKSTPDRMAAAVETAAGIEYVILQRDSAGWQSTHNGQPILAASSIKYEPHILRLGLLTRVADRTAWHHKFERVANFERLDDATAEATYAERMQSRASNYPFPPRWDFFPRAALHDTLLLFALIAYLISLTAIHHWPIWKRLTKAQRRHAKHACPNCAYELVGLNSPTCPECGNNLSSQTKAVNQTSP